MAYDQQLADAEARLRQAGKLPETVTIETWVFIGMLATEVRKVAGNKDATLELANKLQVIANANRK